MLLVVTVGVGGIIYAAVVCTNATLRVMEKRDINKKIEYLKYGTVENYKAYVYSTYYPDEGFYLELRTLEGKRDSLEAVRWVRF